MAGAERVLAAMREHIQDGEHHLRALLEQGDGTPFGRFVEIGLALRRCYRDRARQDYLIERLRPFRKLIIGAVPAGVQRHGLLPADEGGADGRALEDVGDEELRQWLIDDGRLIYGEFKPHELDNYFAAIAPHVRPGGAMYDLGSGLGKVVMSAALAFPFARCTGVELLGYRHRMALRRFAAMLDAGEQALAALPAPPAPDEPLALGHGGVASARHVLDMRERVRFIEQDMFEADVGDASLVFVYSTCFAPLMDKLGEKLARGVPEGCLVSTTTFPLRHPAFRLVEQFPSQTVAWTTVFLYRREGPLEGLPELAPAYLYEPDPHEWEAGVRAAMAGYTAA
ncbi:histone methylation protein DOT1-like protein [Pseudoduganella namucuonensis]|uniref:Histone methylation protein DOT1 n=1 Tax=Pseudoduganella namucuonensis TaxID=1035707 RepID=A0A1I7IIT1_9BURK|nr:histone methylation protein DOT1-like protein [Pseudoduganella namucuonensis]SFU72828.1 Histone methylation protein DOT1 [Pseudoduganella namucuonensis]